MPVMRGGASLSRYCPGATRRTTNWEEPPRAKPANSRHTRNSKFDQYYFFRPWCTITALLELRLCLRQNQAKSSPRCRFAGNGNGAAVQLGDPPRLREPQTRPRPLRDREERIEDGRPDVGGMPGRVGHGEQQMRSAGHSRLSGSAIAE